MRSLRLTLLCFFVAGCAADLPSGSTPPASAPASGAPAGGTVSAPATPGDTAPPLLSHTLPSRASNDPDTPSTSTPTSTPGSGGGSSATPTPTPRPTTSSAGPPTPTPTAKPTASPTAKPTATPTPGQVVATFSGSGPGRTPAFTIPPGYTEFHITHTGSGDFTAWLLNDSRKRLFTIMIRTGSFSEASPLYTPNGGTRYIEVTEGGSWSITVVSD